MYCVLYCVLLLVCLAQREPGTRKEKQGAWSFGSSGLLRVVFFFLGFCCTRSTKEKERIWTSDAAKYYESISSILSDQVDGPIPIQSLKVLLSRESQDDPPQYFIKRYTLLPI